jgi:hypothetical protein
MEFCSIETIAPKRPSPMRARSDDLSETDNRKEGNARDCFTVFYDASRILEKCRELRIHAPSQQSTCDPRREGRIRYPTNNSVTAFLELKIFSNTADIFGP